MPDKMPEPRKTGTPDDYARRSLRRERDSRDFWRWFLDSGRAAVIARAKRDDYVIKA